MPEYRITYAIERGNRESDEWIEIGFGGSGPCADIEGASNVIATVIETYRWDTSEGMPDPEDIEREIEETPDAQ